MQKADELRDSIFVASVTFPVNSIIGTNASDSKTQLYESIFGQKYLVIFEVRIMNDRSQGGNCIEPGVLRLEIERFTAWTDNDQVNEAMMETCMVFGCFLLVFGTNTSRQRRVYRHSLHPLAICRR
jgi:hypothetical protein